MNKPFHYESKLSRDILISGITEAINSTLASSGRTLLGEVEIATSGQSLEGFGDKLLVASAPALTKGGKYIIVAIVRVPEAKDTRTGNVIRAYDAVALRDITGKVTIVALSAIFQPWQPLLDADGSVIPLSELSSEKLAMQYADKPLEYDRLTDFMVTNNIKTVVNSPSAGFKLQLSFEERFAVLQDAVITVKDAIDVKVTLTATGNTAGVEANTKIPAVIKTYAFTVSRTKADLDAFEKAVTTALAKA